VKSQRELDAIVAGLRDAHRELRSPLTNRGIVRVLARERIPRRPARLPVPAMTVLQYGRAAIVIDPNRVRNPRDETAVLAEEYAHAKLHGGERDEVTIHLSSCDTEDPREYEADYLARCLLAGPGVDVEYRTPKPRQRTDRSSQPRRRVPVRTVPPAFDPYAAPPTLTIERRTPKYGGREGETPLQRALRHVRPAPRPMAIGACSDAPLIHYEAGGVVRFIDGEERPWRVYDVAFLPERTVVDLGREVARYRVFVSEAGMRRKYVFRNRWELRDVAARHFERQLREAVDMGTRTMDDRSQRRA
jgi:hypothetical protein